MYTPLTILNANNANKVSIYVALIISPQNWYNFRPSREVSKAAHSKVSFFIILFFLACAYRFSKQKKILV